MTLGKKLIETCSSPDPIAFSIETSVLYTDCVNSSASPNELKNTKNALRIQELAASNYPNSIYASAILL